MPARCRSQEPRTCRCCPVQVLRVAIVRRRPGVCLSADRTEAVAAVSVCVGREELGRGGPCLPGRWARLRVGVGVCGRKKDGEHAATADALQAKGLRRARASEGGERRGWGGGGRCRLHLPARQWVA